MKRALIVVCLAFAACKPDPAREVKIVARPPAPVVTQAPPETPRPASKKSPAPPPNNNIEYCPAPAESGTGPSAFIATGSCDFTHHAAVSCESSVDDFIVALKRPAKNGATLVAYLNVEHYHGPGEYDGAQMFVAVQSGTSIFRWSSDTLKVTVGADEAFVELPSARLEGEPMLVDCSQLMGPETNYQYQCKGRNSTGKIVVEQTAETIAGKLNCKKQPQINADERR